MKKSNLKTLRPWILALVLAVLFVHSMSRGAGVPAVSIPSLVARSEFIAIAGVGTVTKLGEKAVTVNGHTLRAGVFEVPAEIRSVLKGPIGLSLVKVTFIVPFTPSGSIGYGAIPPQRNRLLFLNRGPEGSYEVTDPYYPTLPAPANPGPPSTPDGRPLAADLEKQVAAIECQTIASLDNSPADRVEAIWTLRGRNDPCIADVLPVAFKSSDQLLRLTAADELLTRNDINVLKAALAEVDTLPLTSYLRLNFASAVRFGVRDEHAIPDLRLMLKSEDSQMRRAAASALRNIGTPSCVEGLVASLYDADKDALFYAVLGLAEIENQPEKKPSLEDFDKNSGFYVDYWRTWAKEHVH